MTKIDCLVCHDTTGTYKKVPTGAGMPDPKVDLVAVAGYYMEKYRRQERFSPQELARELAELSAWACQSIEEPFELAVAQGYLERLRDGSYTMTYKGQNYVRNGLTI